MSPKPDSFTRYLRRPNRRNLARVVAEYREFVWRVAYRMTSSSEDAADVCQDVFVKLLVSPPRGENVESVRGYLVWCVFGRVGRLRRSRERRRRREEEHVRRLHERLRGSGESADDVEALDRALDELPRDQRAAIELRYLADLSPGEVASALGITERAVRFRLGKARAFLERRLGIGSATLLGAAGGLHGGVIPPLPEAVVSGLDRITALGTALEGLTAAGAGAGAGVTSSAWTPIITGGSIVSSKKVVAAAVASIAILLGGWWAIGIDDEAGPETTSLERIDDEETGEVSNLGRGAARTTPVEPAADSAAEVATLVPPPNLTGRVTDGLGRGIPEAVVRLIAESDLARPDSELANETMRELGAWSRELREEFVQIVSDAPRVESDVDGSFAFADVAAGDYRLVVSKGGFLPRSDVFVDIRPPAVAEATVELAPAAEIAGRVVDRTGTPIPGVRLTAYAARGWHTDSVERVRELVSQWRRGRILFEPRELQSDENGKFHFDSLEPVVYDLEAELRGYRSAFTRDVKSGTDDVRIEMEPAGVVRGRVVDARGEAVENAAVRLARLARGEVHRLFASEIVVADANDQAGGETRTDATGAFELTGAGTGAFDLVVRADAFPFFTREVEVGEITELGDIVLAVPLEISGRVVDADGAPIADAEVAIDWNRLEVNGGFRSRDTADPLVETRTGDDGTFILEPVSEGEWTLEIRHERYVDATLPGVAAGSSAVDVRLREGVSVAGRVVFEPDGEPIAGAVIKVRQDVPRETTTDENGLFELAGIPIERVLGGRLRIYAEHPEIGHNSELVTLAPDGGKRSEVEFRFPRPSTLFVLARTTDGEPVPRARVRLEVEGIGDWYDEVILSRRLSTDEEGLSRHSVASREGRSFGEVHVVVTHESFAPVRTGPIRWTDHQSEGSPLVVELDRGLELSGKVLDAEGEPIAGARIALDGEYGEAERAGLERASVRATFSGAAGRYRFRRLPRAVVPITVSAPGFARISETIEVAVEPNRDFVLEAGKTLEGRVVDQEGRALAGVQVAARASSVDSASGRRYSDDEFGHRMSLLTAKGESWTHTGEDGRFELRDLGDGEYLIVARRRGYEARSIDAVTAGEPLDDIVLERFAVLWGRATNLRTGEPVREFGITLVDVERRKRIQRESGMTNYRAGSVGSLRFADSAGRYSYDGLTARRYEIQVLADGFRPYRRELTLDAGEAKELDLALDPGATITGRVVTEAGKPIPGVHVRAALTTDAPEPGSFEFYHSATATSSETGEFRLEGLTPGEHKVRARDALWALVEKPAPIVVDRSAHIELRMREVGRIEGRVNTNLSRASVKLEKKDTLNFRVEAVRLRDGQPDPNTRMISFVNSDRFEFESLEPGTYRVRVNRQVMRPGKRMALGPNAGLMSLEEVGEPETILEEDVEVSAGQTSDVVWDGR